MSVAENMLEALSKTDTKVNTKNRKSDYDFNKVLEFCSSDSIPRRKIRCFDGEEKEFLFQ